MYFTTFLSITVSIAVLSTDAQVTTDHYSCGHPFNLLRSCGNVQCPETQATDNEIHEKRINMLESIVQNQQEQLALFASRLKAGVSDGKAEITTSPGYSPTYDQHGSGVNYIRYGHKQCANERTLVYGGYVGKSYYNQGGGVNYLCLPKDPEWPTGVREGLQSGALIYGVEYQPESSPVMPESTDNQDVPCAVCESRGKFQKLMIPAKKTCPNGWTKEYSGLLMSERTTHKGSDFICVDGAMQENNGGVANENGGLLYVVEARCGSLSCPPYVEGYEISCVVCTK